MIERLFTWGVFGIPVLALVAAIGFKIFAEPVGRPCSPDECEWVVLEETL